MQKQTWYDWKAFRRHIADCEYLQIVNNSLLLMYATSIVFRGEKQTLCAEMAETPVKVYFSKCKINYA